MHNSKAVTEYWQHALKVQALASFTPEKASSAWRVITADECKQGKIENQTIAASLLARGSLVVVAPYYAQKINEYFIPILLLAEIDSSGVFISKAINAWPVIPKAVLEPAELKGICLGSEQNFDNYFILQPPIWIDDPKELNWQQQLKYAQDMLQQVTGGVWQQQLMQQQYAVADGALVLPLSAIHTDVELDDKILGSKAKIELIDAERNSGKSEYAKKLVLDAWIEAAVKQAPPPAYVWLRYQQQPRFCNILDYVGSEAKSLAFMSAQDESSDTHKDLAHCFTTYIRGRQVMRNWDELQQRLHNKYADKGGILARIEQLKTVLKEAQVRQRHMQVLLSIWTRQLELVPSWSKIFDFVPSMQPRRLQRLHAFFKQNFPAEDVRGFNQDQLETLMLERVRRAENTLRFIADTLHQTETDLHQQDLVKEKCLQWARSYNPDLQDVDAMLKLLNEDIWNKLVSLAVQYWQAFFSLNKEYMNFATQEPQAIDVLIVEHAEYVSPMQAAQLIGISKRSIVMGNYNAICNPRFSPHIDYDIAKQFKLIDCDADFEDLQFDGVLSSMGNMWSLATRGKDSSQTFTSRKDQSLQYTFVDVNAGSSEFSGSRINIAEANAVLQWLIGSKQACNGVAIYTTFSGQAYYLRKQLQGTKYASVQVHLIQEPCCSKTAISLFSPVYTAADAGPYCFDRGVEILQNLTSNTTEQVLVFGDRAIFNSALHSASGNFAKLFNPDLSLRSENIIQEQEVNCV